MSQVMKILILNPHIDAQHPIVQALKARGDAVLVSSQVEEGWKILQVHGSSIDLAVLHREGLKGGEPGTELNAKIKKTSTFADLPILFSSEAWNDGQCAAHQQTPVGANAYLHWPFDGKKLIETIEAIFGPAAASELPRFDDTHAPTLSIVAPAPKLDMASMVLEDPSQIFDKSALQSSGSGIQLSAFEGKPENTNVNLTPQSTSAIAAAKVDTAPATSDISQLLKPNMEAPLDLLDISVSEASVAQPAPPVQSEPSAPAFASAPAFEGALDLLSGDAPAPDSPPAFPEVAPEAVSAIQPLDLNPPSPVQEHSPDALELPEIEETFAKPSDNAAIENELPYLFGKQQGAPLPKGAAIQPQFSHPVGDSVVPGGAANAPDIETLKKYLLLREQDVAALSGQLKATREENVQLHSKFRDEQDRAEGLNLLADDQKKKIEEFEKEKAIALETLTSEIAELRFQSKAKADKAKLLEIQVNEASQEIERLKDRVRSDIRKIRVRERELENQLEMTKKDSEVVLGAREAKIVELKRKIDLLEFNMDLLQDRFNRERESNNKLREKLGKAAQVVRVAEGLLDEPQANDHTAATERNGAAESLTAGKFTSNKAS